MNKFSNKVYLVGETIMAIQLAGKTLQDLEAEVKRLPRSMRDVDIFGFLRPQIGAFTLGTLGARVAPDPMAGGYDGHVEVEDGDADFDTSAELDDIADIAAGASVRLWEMTMGVREMRSWGSGVKGLVNNQGYVTAGIFDTGTDIQQDRWRLAVESWDRSRKVTVDSFNDTETNLQVATSVATMRSTNNQTKMRALPRTKAIAMPNSRLVIDIDCLVAATDPDAVFFGIPCTVKTG